jgi:hypothetical protein
MRIGQFGGRKTFPLVDPVNLTDTAPAKPYQWDPRVPFLHLRLVCDGMARYST